MLNIATSSASPKNHFNPSTPIRAFSADVGCLSTKSEKILPEFFLPKSDQSHRVYNFEVSKTHTYVADGIRVHNTSILSFVEPHEFSSIQELTDTDDDGSLDFVLLKEPGSAIEIQKTLQGDVAIEEHTYSDGMGNVLYSVLERDLNGTSTVIQAPTYLQGQFIGEGIGKTLTPFLTSALIGDDPNVFEKVAVDTVLDTVLENLGGTIGALIHRGQLDYGSFAVGEHIDTISEAVFEDFGGELIVNGINNVSNVVNQLIMSEIMEFVDVDGVPGAVLEAVIGAGINNVVTAGAEWLVNTDGFEALFENKELLEQVQGGVKTSTLPDGLLGASGWASLIMGAVVRELLPDLETKEGQLTSAITGVLLATSKIVSGWISSLGVMAGPVGAVIAWAVGALVDLIFDKDPEAWAEVDFDENLNEFKIGQLWSNDGGDEELAEGLANSYVNGMNNIVELVKSNSNNFEELGAHVFGHYESKISNAGSSGENYAVMQAAYLDAYIADLANLQLNDGQQTAVKVLRSLNLQELMEKRKIDETVDPIVFSKVRIENNEPAEALNSEEIADAVIEGIEENGTESEEPQFEFVLGEVEGAVETIVIEGGNFYSYDGMNPMEVFAKITSALQIARDYQTYLENIETVNAIMAASPDSAFTAGWYATIIEADRLGLTDDIVFDGDELSNNIMTAEGDDVVTGGMGDDVIKTYFGEDTLFGDQGNDDLFGGESTDTLFGGEGNDTLEGGNGEDFIYGGEGIDWLSYRAASSGIKVALDEGLEFIGDAEGDSFFEFENLLGSIHDDVLRADENDNEVDGGLGDDKLHGLYGADTLQGNDGDDTLYGGMGADKLNGGSGSDTASYQDSDEAVTVALLNSKNLEVGTGIAEGDQFDSIEVLLGSEFHDILYSNHGGSTVVGAGGDDIIHGLSVSTASYAGELEDQNFGHKTYIGGQGDDTIYGAGSSETYIYSLGDGRDTIYEAHELSKDAHTLGNNDRLLFDDLNANDVLFELGESDDLIIRMADGGLVTIKDHFNHNTYKSIERIEFADGETLKAQNIRDKMVADMKANGIVGGTDSRENYFHILGDGGYVITDYDYGTQSATDIFTFTDVNMEDVVFSWVSGDLRMSLSNGEVVTIRNHFHTSGDYSIEEIAFADGAILNLEGIKTKTFSDPQEGVSKSGGSASNNYFHALGDGSYVVTDYDPYAQSGTDVFNFSDVTSDQVFFSWVAGDLAMTLANGETITINNHFDMDWDYNMEKIVFADGEVMTNLDIQYKSVSDQKITGAVRGSERQEHYFHGLGDGSYVITDFDPGSNSSTDVLHFTDVNSSEVTFDWVAGDLEITLSNGETVTINNHFDMDYDFNMERIIFADGEIMNNLDIQYKSVADQKDSGTVRGTERLEHYFHELGDGSYVITDFDPGTNSNTDVFHFTDVTSSDVTSERVFNDLIFTLENGEKVTINNHFDTDWDYRMEKILFADGEQWSDALLS